MEFTGERFIPLPELLNDEIGIEHFHRYHSVIDIVKNKAVLDIACGEGYGSAIMAPFAKSVTGVDIDPECIRHASKKYTTALKNISFSTGSVIEIPFADKSFEVIISFETIEHITSSQQILFLAEAKRVLKDDGILVISTPDKTKYNSHNKPVNEFHAHELEKSEFREILENKFSHVNFFVQGYEISSLITSEQPEHEADYARLIRLHGKVGNRDRKYIVAIASDTPVHQSLTSVITDTDKSYEKNIARILQLQEEVEDRSSWALRLDKQRIENEAIIAVLKEQSLNNNKEIFPLLLAQMETVKAFLNEWGHFTKKLDDKEKRIDELNDKLKQAEIDKNENDRKDIRYQQLLEQQLSEIKGLSQQLEEKRLSENKLTKESERLRYDLTEANIYIDKLKDEAQQSKDIENKYLTIIGERNAQIVNGEEKYNGAVSELNDLKMLTDELRQKMHLLYSELDSYKGRLSEIYASEGWAVLKRYYNIKGRLLYENSWRYKTLKKIVNKIRNKKNSDIISSDVSIPVSNNLISIEKTEEAVGYGHLKFTRYDSPEVSIIIPVYNGFKLTYQCLASILKNTFGVTYEIIIGDDCSQDETVNINDWIENIEVVRHSDNLGFLKNCNKAATYARGKYILFLNNDTEVTPGWLSSLSNLLDKNPAIGMAGSKLIYPDGRLQEAGGIIWNDASGWNYGHKQDPEAPEFNYVKEVDYISGASIIIRSALWKEIGGFDELFSPAYCEDTDLAFMVRQKEYKVVYQPLSQVIHHEGSSHGSEKSKAYQQINNKKFFSKWEKVLSTEHFSNGENVFLARDKSSSKKTILVIDHYVPQFDKDAGSRTVLQFLKIFIDLGMNVKFIGDNFYKHEPYTTVLQQMGIEVLYGSYCAENWQNWLMNNREHIDYILLNRPHISIKYIDFLKLNMPGKLLYYGHDLHFRREQKKYDLEKSPSILEAIKKWEKIEKYIFGKSDIILAPSEEEKTIIDGMLDHEKAILVRPYTYEAINPPIDNFSTRKNILFVGGFNHGPNVDGVLWFVNEVWPFVRQAIPDDNFFIVGSHPPEEIQKLNGFNNIVVKGFVSDTELDSLYASVRLVVIPLRYGAGVKGKTVETIYKGIPFISTSFGVEGLPGDSSFLQSLVADQAIEFCQKVCELYKDADQLKKHSSSLIHYIKEYFTFDQGKKIFASIFTDNN